MADWKARNQGNKAVVWEFWQRMNHAQAHEVPGIINKAFHKDVDWNGPQPINQINGSDALIRDFWEVHGLRNRVLSLDQSGSGLKWKIVFVSEHRWLFQI